MNNRQDAINFFKKSGELRQEKTGAPEYMIIFTSKEVIEGKEKPRALKDEWFNLKNINHYSIPQIIVKTLNKLINECSFPNFYDNGWIKDIYFLSVKHDDFKDCYEKIYTTIKSLASKEVWINLIGGTNQINLSLFLSSCLTGIGTKYIYIFQKDISKLHPEIERPDFKNPKISIPPEGWQEIPFIWIGLESEILKEIRSLFQYRSTLHVKEIRRILNKYKITQQYLAKLQSSSLIHIENDKVTKGIGFDIIKNLEIKTEINDFSNWKKWAKNDDILYKIDINPPHDINKL